MLIPILLREGVCPHCNNMHPLDTADRLSRHWRKTTSGSLVPCIGSGDAPVGKVREVPQYRVRS